MTIEEMQNAINRCVTNYAIGGFCAECPYFKNSNTKKQKNETTKEIPKPKAIVEVNDKVPPVDQAYLIALTEKSRVNILVVAKNEQEARRKAIDFTNDSLTAGKYRDVMNNKTNYNTTVIPVKTYSGRKVLYEAEQTLRDDGIIPDFYIDEIPAENIYNLLVISETPDGKRKEEHKPGLTIREVLKILDEYDKDWIVKCTSFEKTSRETTLTGSYDVFDVVCELCSEK